MLKITSYAPHLNLHNLVTGLVICLASTVLLAQPSKAPDKVLEGTLAKIKSTQTINMGVRESSRPFSFLNEDKKPVGYSVDLCLAVVENIKRELKLTELKVNYVVVQASERIPKLEAGVIDLECGSTTNTKARQEKVDFSYTYFVAGMKIMAPTKAAINTVRELSGLPVAISKGTTSDKLFTQLNGSGEVKMNLISFPNNLEAFKALREGKVRAYPQDDVLLLGMASKENVSNEMVLSETYMSIEPYAIMMRNNDTAMVAIANKTLSQIFSSGDINAIYNKWFDTPTFKVPMGKLTRDSFARPNSEAGVALMLGYAL
jgi:glutamate/aspartate transport system substrate-binding protein